MKVVCVNNSYAFGMVSLTRDGITVSKIYEVIEVNRSSNLPATFYLIKNDYGRDIEYNSDHFKELSDLRNDKLE
jgi:hypothetical protein